MVLVLVGKMVMISFGNGYGINVAVFGCDLSNSSHANNKKSNILVLVKDFVQGINGTTIYAEGLNKVKKFKNSRNS